MRDPYTVVLPRPYDVEFIAVNIRGIMLAAFMPPEEIQHALGCSFSDAVELGGWARSDLEAVRTVVAQAKHRMAPKK